MDGEALELVARIARVIAVTLTACGLFLVFLDVGETAEPSRLRRRLEELWRNLAAVPVDAIAPFVVAALMRSVDRFVVYWYEQSPRNVVTAGTHTIIVFVAIPVAAILNWFRGGSPTLMLVLIGCVLGMAVLAVLTEIRTGPVVARILSPVLYSAVFLFVPGYVFVSLTGRMLSMPIGHAMLASILLSPVLYLIGHAAVLLGTGAWVMPVASRDATAVRHVLTLSLAALPFAYIATFAAFLLWHVFAPELPVPSSWQTLVGEAVAGAGIAAATCHILSHRYLKRSSTRAILMRLGIGIGLAVLAAIAISPFAHPPAGEGLVLLPVPLLGPMAILAIIVLAAGARIALALLAILPGVGNIAHRPYRVAGVLTLALAVGAGWASIML